MELMENLDKYEIKEFFSKGWLTHDAMWFYHCLQEFGAEHANSINKSAIKSMAAVEINRILKLMNREKEPVDTFDSLREIIDTTFKFIQPRFMKIYYDFPEKNVFRGGFSECFAYEGVRKFGLIDLYQCGVLVRIHGWLDSLGVQYEMVPDFTGCLMHRNRKCEIMFRFNLD